METLCPLCGHDQTEIVLTTIDFSNTKETFQIVRCNHCQLTYTSPKPDQSSLGKYYASSSYISHQEKAKSLIDLVYLQARRFTLRWKVSLIRSITQEKRILDFGCGAGEFITFCKSHGYDAFGFEPIHAAASIAKQKVPNRIETQIASIKGAFPIITLWHVLEHVYDLDKTIATLKNHLQKNGTMFIAVPNHKSHDAKKYQQHWAGWDVPRHLWHFDKKTITALTEKHNLKVKQIIPMKLDPYYISLVSEQYKSGKTKTKVSSIFRAIREGWNSNNYGKTTGEYSSLIYVIAHA